MKIFSIALLVILAAFLNIYSQDIWEKTEGSDTVTGGSDTVTTWSLAINSSGDIFAGTHFAGVFRSTDNGVSWTNLGITNYEIRSMAISSSDDILVNTDPWGGVRRSSDNGINWTNIGFAHFNHSIAIDDDTVEYIYVGTQIFGISRTTDNGANWVPVNNGMTASKVPSLKINSNGHVFAGTYGSGIFRTLDKGENWVQTNADSLYVLSLAINSNGDIFAGTSGSGAFRSTDNGDSWVQINQGLFGQNGQGYYVFSLAISLNGDIFAGTAEGVFQSTNNGDNWVQINQGLTNLDVHSLAINFNGDVFAGTDAGIFRTIPSANIKVFLQGPYSSGTMSTALRDSGYVPLAQPYNVAPYNYNGVEAVTSIPAGIVDWVLLELRSDSATQVSRRAAFLKSDGSLVDLDGVSNVKFPTVVPRDYYVVIRHRNHLAVMTANKVTLSNSPAVYDMRTDQSKAYGTSAMKDLGGGNFGMYAGDGNSDGLVTSTDFNVFNPKFISAANGYEYSDWNLDGLVTSTDFNFFIPNFTTAKQTFVP
jgi:photosystem II stability/assembly factor-like uncharacterized protein